MMDSGTTATVPAGFYELSRGVEEVKPEGKDFGGIPYRFHMLCEHDLEIGGLRFFGPHRNSRNTDLFVTIGFEESDFNQRQNSFNMNMFFRASYYAVQGEKGKDFFVNFDVPVFIPKGNWVAIKFQIDGGLTAQMARSDTLKTVHFIEDAGIRVDTVTGPSNLAGIFLRRAKNAETFYETIGPSTSAVPAARIGGNVCSKCTIV